MIRAQAQTNLDNLTGLRQEILDRTLVLRGEFDAEIKHLEAVRDEAISALGRVDTVKAAEKVRKDADAYATTTRAAADKAAETASAALAQANAKMEAALGKEKEVDSREAQALSVMADYEAKARTFDTDCAKREARIATREAALSAAQAKLAEDAAKLNARQRELIERLDAAKVLASQ